MQLSDRFTGLFLVVLGGLAAYGGSRLPPVPGQQIGPNVFPMVVGAGLVICGALIAFGIGRQFEDEAEAELAAHSAETEAGGNAWWRGLMALVPPALLLIIVFTTATALGARLLISVPLAIGAPLFVHLVFSKLLRVPLPPGLIPAPW
jgi:putative tricarboxylic transport membrane protein